MNLGYVVIEFNQASHQPALAWHAPHLYTDKDDAQEMAQTLRHKAVMVGRRERYAVAVVEEDE